MDGITILLGVGLLTAGAGLVWILQSRSIVVSRAAAAEAKVEAMEGERTRQAAEVAQERLAARAEIERRERDLAAVRGEVEAQAVELAKLTAEIAAAEQRHVAEMANQRTLLEERRQAIETREREFRAQIESTQQQMAQTFRAMSAEAMSKGSADLLKLAEERFQAQRQANQADAEARRLAVEQLVKPIGEVLQKTDAKLAELATAWTGDKAALAEQLRAFGTASEGLRTETGKLVRALREPHVRGRYGEVQLKRVAELAGMVAYCDFSTQDQVQDDEGNALRPDMVVRLPNQRVVIVDAKTNIQSYLDAQHAQSPEEAEAHLERFAAAVAKQATDLGRKKYWSLPDYAGSPEFVVMFVPGDAFLDAALARRPDLLEHAAATNVLLATPATLIALLRAVAVGYQEQRLAKAAEELRELGKELQDRAATAFQHVAGLGESLERAVRRYNEFVGSYEQRLLPTLRKFEDSGIRGGKPLPEAKPLETRPRPVAGALPAPGRNEGTSTN